MSKFKVGDKVRCIDSRKSREIREGSVYQVAGIDEKFGSIYPFPEDHPNALFNYNPKQFELVKDSSSTIDELIQAKEKLEKELLTFIDSKVQAFQTEFPNARMDSLSFDFEHLHDIDRKIPKLLVTEVLVRIVL